MFYRMSHSCGGGGGDDSGYVSYIGLKKKHWGTNGELKKKKKHFEEYILFDKVS